MVYPYYDNPGMLTTQISEWMMYDAAIKRRLRIIIIDDASPKVHAATIVTRYSSRVGISTSVFRVTKDIPWGQDGARNIGMHHCTTDWALMTDIDHVLMRDQVGKMLFFAANATRGNYYLPKRERMNMQPHHPHPNTFLFNREDFWAMGGYDEDFVGWYGSDGNFRKCCKGAGLRELPASFTMTLFGIEDCYDANSNLSRKEGPYCVGVMFVIKYSASDLRVR